MAEPMTFQTEVLQDEGSSACALPLPFDPRERFGRVRAPVVVTVSGHSYRSTVFAMGGRWLVPLARGHREAAGVSGGDTVSVQIRLDEAPRDVEAPRDLREALARAGFGAERWEALSFTRRKEAVCAVQGAKRPATRARRIARIVEELAG